MTEAARKLRLGRLSDLLLNLPARRPMSPPRQWEPTRGRKEVRPTTASRRARPSLHAS